MRKVYISGPMRGLPKSNYPAFTDAAALLRAQGFSPISPVEISRLYEGWPDAPPMGADSIMADRVRYIRRDINALLDLNSDTDAIYMLDGWDESAGAVVEIALARYMGLEVIHQHSL